LSDDGISWRKVIDRIDNHLAAETLHAGVAFWTVPGQNRTVFHGMVDQIKIEQPGELPSEPDERLNAENGVTIGRINGLVRGNSDGSSLYARGNGIGLLRSDDSGETWQSCNGDLTAPAAMAVRSVAVHPTNPAVLLRGGGDISDDTPRSGLWRSEDSGEQWTQVSSDLDFDGTTARTLFGETIAFSPHDPSIVAAAGETNGLYMSHDGGLTWNYQGLKGERVTCVAFNPYQKGMLVIGTCPDSELGRLGFSGFSVSDEPGIGRLHLSRDNGKNLSAMFEMPAWGMTDIRFEKMRSSVIYGATTRGLYYTFNLTGFYQRRHGLEPDRLHVAIDEFRPDVGRSDVLSGPFSGEDQMRLYEGRIGYYWSPVWKRLPDAPSTANLRSAVYLNDLNSFCIATQDGIFRSTDHGTTYRCVYPTDGN
ncbi:MAG: hypothetical protein HN341_13170, partial [Verrucomicrobia bacterium]|nr:hypothetical protein [Verrucomicrobiota bacterium]